MPSSKKKDQNTNLRLKKNYSLKEVPIQAGEHLSDWNELERTLLWHRGVRNKDDALKFLNPNFEDHTHDPFLLNDMGIAAERILKAIENNEKIGVWSDYDADGIPGGALMYCFFKEIGFDNFVNYIPDRHLEGYGLNIEGVDSLYTDGIKLIITVDCGVRDIKQIERANNLGIDVIVTDHHEQGDTLPPAFAVINPKRKDSTYPEQVLCGTGVAWKLIEAILKTKRNLLPVGQEKWLLDLVGIATLSDMVPLTGENRVLATYGLKVMRKARRPGLRKLLQSLRVYPNNLVEDDITFLITPRINAASRMGCPRDAFELLTETDEAKIDAIIKHLTSINNERKVMVATIVREVNHKIKERIKIIEQKSVIVLGNPDWRPSLLGLAANSVAKEFGKPVFLWGREGGDIIKGSCRSDGAIDLVALMEKAKDSFIDFGGHKMSGGFSLKQDNIHNLEDVLSRFVSSVEKLKEVFFADASVSVDDIRQGKLNFIKNMSPFGIGNEKPVFMFEGVLVDKVSRFGKGKEHLEVFVKGGSGFGMKAISFFTEPDKYTGIISEGALVNMLANIETSYFGGKMEERLRIVDFI